MSNKFDKLPTTAQCIAGAFVAVFVIIIGILLIFIAVFP